MRLLSALSKRRALRYMPPGKGWSARCGSRNDRCGSPPSPTIRASSRTFPLPMKIRVVLVDDHAVFREGLAYLLAARPARWARNASLARKPPTFCATAAAMS